jgi:hypothetical protein
MFSRTVPRKAWLAIFGATLVANAGFAIGACSSSSSVDDGDGGTGSEAGGQDGAKDGPVNPNTDGSTGKDGGHCSIVKGACDIVLQDCANDSKGQKQECVVVKSGADYVTQCVPVQASQQLAMGAACCPPTSAKPDNPCLPGLSCGGPDCVDGGPKTGRCSPACCKGDDQSCGKSDPEGIAGACDLSVFIDNQEMFNTCSYRERCKPFGIESCKAGEACLVEDKIGTSSCLGSNGKQLGDSCIFANDCVDGLFCLTLSGMDAGTCRMQCLTPGATHPFDAGVEDGGPGAGGCPVKTCPGSVPCCGIGPFTDLPSWLSFCKFPDGG